MNLKKSLIALAVLLLLVVPSVVAQHRLPASATVEEYRPVGDRRYWSVIVHDSLVGGLSSVVRELTTINGRPGLTIAQTLKLDYTKVGQERRIETTGAFYVKLDGTYLGDSKEIGFGQTTESLELRRKDDTVSGYFTRRGNRVSQTTAIKKDAFAYDQSFYDELELLLAMTDLEVGQPLQVNLFEPQTQLSMQLSGFVEDFAYVGLYEQHYDSVFLINVFSPQSMYAMMTRDKRLVKIDIPDQQTKVYLDLVKKEPVNQQFKPPTFGLIRFLALLKNYLLYLLVSILATLLFVGRAYRWKLSYVAYIGAAASFWLMVSTQFPLQQWIFTNLFLPAMKQGGSIYSASLLPALPPGLFQTAICFLLVWGISRSAAVKDYQLVALGAVVGAGFGFMEACYLDSISGRIGFDIGILERVALLLYHPAAAALAGYFVAFNRKHWWVAAVAMLIVNSLFRYLPILVQTKVLRPQVLVFAMLAIALACQFLVVVVNKQRLFRAARTD